MTKRRPFVPTEDRHEHAIEALEKAMAAGDAGLEPHSRAVVVLIQHARLTVTELAGERERATRLEAKVNRLQSKLTEAAAAARVTQ